MFLPDPGWETAIKGVQVAVFVVVKQALSLITDEYNLFFGIFFMLVVAFFRGGILGTLRTLIGKWR